MKCARYIALAAVIAVLGCLATVEAKCANQCNGHGNCNTGPLVKCQCWQGWEGADCSLRSCPTGDAWADEATAVDTAHAHTALCSNRGTCDYATGTCKCQTGFEGKACQRLACHNDCSGHGVCRSMRRSAELDWSSISEISYTNVWDANMIYGCNCDEGWEGSDCSLRTCVRSDDHLTSLDPSGYPQVNEYQFMVCQADGGFFTLSLDGRISEQIAWDATDAEVKAALEPDVTPVNIVFMESGQTTVCEADGGVTRIEFIRRFGDVPIMRLERDYQNFLTLTASTASVVLRDGTSGDNDIVHDSVTYTARQGTKEYDYCANRGMCDQKRGECICYAGYATSDFHGDIGVNADCGHSTTPITACPGAIECSGHGVCSDHPTYRCSCETGWMGGDCSERTCPTGHSWFDAPTEDDKAHEVAECSNRGLCDRSTGKCSCAPGFTGTACERMVCPGSDRNCNGHGRCMSMAQLAEVANVNGDAASFTYGRNLRNSYTWDYNKVFGCHCDEGYHGYDCSLRDCARGDDPKTTNDVAEVQLIKCTATAGVFTLSFRQYPTGSIAFTATTDEVKAALESLDSVDEVEVTYSDGGSTLCVAGGTNVAQITFTQNFGDLPNLILASDDLTPVSSLTVGQSSETDGTDTFTAVDGTKENDYCSNRGVCNEKTGLCECFDWYGPSNGYGSEGTRQDCGAVMPIQPISKAKADLTVFLAREEQFGAQDAAELDF